jgi:hypothetical protein
MKAHWDSDHPTLWGREEGRRRRDEGIRLVTMAVDLDPWYANALRAIKAQTGPFCSDHIRDYAGDPPRPNALGALFNQAAKAGLCEWRGELTQSERPEAHGRLIKLWHPQRSA